MSESTLSRGGAWSCDLFPPVLLVGGSLNGFLVRLTEAWQRQGPDILLGVSPFELIILIVAARLLLARPSGVAPTRFGLVEALTTATFLVPSSAVSWLAVACYAGTIAWRTDGPRRAGALLFLGLGLASLWSSVILKGLALPVTSAEAWIVASLLSLLRADISQAGNVIATGAGHSVVLMTACSSLEGLPKSLLATVAIAHVAAEGRPHSLIPVLAGVGAAYLLANLVRLTLITWSAPMFALAHGPIGANAFDAAMTILVLAAGMQASRE